MTGEGWAVSAAALAERLRDSGDLADPAWAAAVAETPRVLEIGTGTGYNAALLAHRLGDENVYSVDVAPELVRMARKRLAEIGRRPRLAEVDGVGGWPEHGPYDRIIATCAVPNVPTAWLGQVTDGGKVLVDVKVNTGAGNLVLLTKHEDCLEGRFTKRWAAFMAMRHDGDVDLAEAPKAEGHGHRRTTAPARPWDDHREVWFLAARALPTGLRYGYTLDPATRQPTASMLRSPDGSWCHVSEGVVREGGPTPLWAAVERAYEWWRDHGDPGWERFGLTVGGNGWTLWLDEPGRPVHC
ncbi:methyltransferase domain-containing protein [Kutzneria chonburiensis]|uniref:Protein-L-isoaspartate O-methyltransferase n=1 Tax=Kutzneria chonburiensis TaxID=1483604 RepID=A0ABV6MMG7_9PSEU|nr:methyltransferase domain-containing protein [Kutzneria chonburiensis]